MSQERSNQKKSGRVVTLDASGMISSSVLPASSSSSAVEEIEIDFGSSPVYSKKISVTGATGVSAASKIVVTPSGSAATGQTEDVWEADMITFAAKATGSGTFTIYASAFPGPVSGKRKVYYILGN